MSSPHSLQRPPGADELTAIGAAALHVLETTLAGPAELCEPARFAALLGARQADERWLAATVGFGGAFDGAAHLALPYAVAADLAAGFCGSAVGPGRITDFTGELANMVCGRWLTETHRAERFVLSAPRVARTSTASVLRILDTASIAVRLSIGGAPLLIAVASPRGGAA